MNLPIGLLAIALLLTLHEHEEHHGGSIVWLGAATFAAAVAVLLVGVTTILVYHAHLGWWRLAGLAVALVLGAVPFALLGVAFGYWLPPRAALPAANLLFLVLAIVGSLWARPPDDLPREADIASQLVPTRSWVEVLDSIATGDHRLPLHHVAALVAWSLLFLALAWWGYRRDEGERFT